jgi:hypothetical protein
MFDVKGLSCALLSANCQHGRSVDDPLQQYPSLCVWVKQSRFESQRIQVSPERFFPKCLNQRARHWWRSFTLSGFENMTVYV